MRVWTDWSRSERVGHCGDWAVRDVVRTGLDGAEFPGWTRSGRGLGTAGIGQCGTGFGTGSDGGRVSIRTGFGHCGDWAVRDVVGTGLGGADLAGCSRSGRGLGAVGIERCGIWLGRGLVAQGIPGMGGMRNEQFGPQTIPWRRSPAFALRASVGEPRNCPRGAVRR